jgi:hypothetical protein
LNVWTPLSADDWRFHFIFDTSKPIRDIFDVIKSLSIYYYRDGGRIVPHVFAFSFDGFIGKSVFNVINTIAFILFLHLINFQVSGEGNFSYINLSFSFILILFLFPGFKDCFLWMTGACNYLWSGLFVLSFILVMQRVIKNIILFPFLLLFGTFCGCTHEGISVALFAAYIVYYIINRKEINIGRIVLLIGFLLGLIVLVASPGSFERVVDKGITSNAFVPLLHRYVHSLLMMNNLRLFYVLIVLILLLPATKLIRTREFVKSNLLWFLALAFSFVLILASANTSERSRFGIELFSLIIILKLLVNIKVHIFVAHILNVLTSIFLVYVIHLCYLNYNEFLNEEKQILNNQQLVITNHKFPNEYLKRYVLYIMVDNSLNKSFNPYFMFNRHIEKFYNKKCISFLPQTFIDDINRGTSFVNFKSVEGATFYAKEVKQNFKVRNIAYYYEPTDFRRVPFYIRPFAKYMERYTLQKYSCNSFCKLKIKNKTYLLIEKDGKSIDRVERIEIVQ